MQDKFVWLEIEEGVFTFPDEESDIWEGITPEDLAQQIEKKTFKIKLDLNERGLLVELLDRVRKTISRPRWEAILLRLVPTYWMGVNGDGWDPVVLINGGLLIQNLHRTLTPNLDEGVSISGIQPLQLRQEIALALSRGRELDDPYSVFLLHHGRHGALITQHLPREQFRGQTFLFAERRILSDLPVFADLLDSDSDDSTMFTIRLYDDVMCRYETGRLSDDFSALARSSGTGFYESEFEEPSRIIIPNESQLRDMLDESLMEDLEQEFDRFDISSRMKKDLTHRMLSREPYSFASEAFAMLEAIPPVFAPDYRRPPGVSLDTPLGSSGRRFCDFEFEQEVTESAIQDAIAASGIESAQMAVVTAAHARVPFRSLPETDELTKSLRRHLGLLCVSIPHLGLVHREPNDKRDGSNGSWFGFGVHKRMILSDPNRRSAKRRNNGTYHGKPNS